MAELSFNEIVRQVVLKLPLEEEVKILYLKRRSIRRGSEWSREDFEDARKRVENIIDRSVEKLLVCIQSGDFARADDEYGHRRGGAAIDKIMSVIIEAQDSVCVKPLPVRRTKTSMFLDVPVESIFFGEWETNH